ncbi:MAG: type II toxin-antitoxin system VapC family toxin [Bacteroidetes bacterium]|nr:type II toxin-antitoxin system VapC family toxin [Bacteroidota bacterium]MCH8034607.1 type II toxin-antitoxin system VapC family toxin [Bacteroidota bacterium]
MKVFFDSTALAKRYIDEEGSDDVEKMCRQTDVLSVSIICLPEIISALNRLRREKQLNKRQYEKIKESLIYDLEEADFYNLTPQVVNHSIQLLEKYALRAMDALHIACALVAQPDLFVSSDQKQLAAAKKAGLKIRLV